MKARLENDKPPKILVIEDEPETAKVICALLARKLKADCTTALDVESAGNALRSNGYDLVTIDYQLPDGNGLELLDQISDLDDSPPAIMVTGHGDERTAVEAFKRGAAGYVVKDSRLATLLVEESERAIKFNRAVTDLRNSEQQLRLLTENMVDVVSWIDRSLRFVYVSPSITRSFGYRPEEIIGHSALEFVFADDEERISSQIHDSVAAAANSLTMRYRGRIGNGDYIWIESATRLLVDESGEFDGAILVSRDVSERMEEEELAKAQRDLAMELGEMTDTPEITIMALNKMLEVTGLDCGGVYSYAPAAHEFVLVYHAGLTPEFIQKVQRMPAGDPAARLVLEGKPIFSGERPGMMSHDLYVREGLKQLSVVPLRYQGEVIGSLNAASHTREALSERQKHGIIVLSAIIGQAFGRSRLLGALERSESRFRHLFDFMGEGAFTYDPDLRLTAINRRACEMTGVCREEVLGRNIMDLGIIHPDCVEEVAHNIQKLFAGEPVVHSVYKIVTRAGEVRFTDVTSTALRDEDGVLTEVTNVVVDVTERLEAEERLSRSEERYRALFEQAPLGVFLYDRNGVMTESNLHNAEMMGTTVENLIGFDLHDARDPRVMPHIEASLRGEVSRYEGEYVTTINGRTVETSITFSPLYDGAGNVIGGMGMAEDISERLRDEEELRRVNRELLDYAQTISHDLKGPIVNIQMSADALVSAIRAGMSMESLQEVLEILEQNSKKVFTRIDDLLVLARAGQAPVATEDVDVGGVVQEVIGELEPLIQSRNARVLVDEDLGRLQANSTQLFQLFVNLTRNAIEHNPEEAPVVKVKRLETRAGHGHRYRVCDNGPGIQAEETLEIFRPFIKGDDSGGTGIGLSIVERIIRAYRGEIIAYNDEGACFEFTLFDARRA